MWTKGELTRALEFIAWTLGMPPKLSEKENDKTQGPRPPEEAERSEVRSRADTRKHLWFPNSGLLKGSITAGTALMVLMICIFPSTSAVLEPAAFFPRVQFHQVYCSKLFFRCVR